VSGVWFGEILRTFFPELVMFMKCLRSKKKKKRAAPLLLRRAQGSTVTDIRLSVREFIRNAEGGSGFDTILTLVRRLLGVEGARPKIH
jgi:hypothetical protein